MTFRLGTRGSALALHQATLARDAIQSAHTDGAWELVVVKTTGDRVTDKALFKIGGKGLFTKELEERLLDGTLDLAVHSLKDLPTELPAGLAVGAVLPRGAPSDALITTDGGGIEALPSGARLGTSSLRRRAQLRSLRPDLEMTDLRGNLDTRLAKLAREDMDGIVAARAGLDRLGFDGERFRAEDLPEILPAPGQGAIALEVRADREDLRSLLETLNHGETEACVLAERAFLGALGGGCHVPIGALGFRGEGGLRLRGLVASLDGSKVVVRESETASEPEALGRELAAEILEAGGREILAELEEAGLA
ncbi:MAG: hydroxymethylbilane synthase [Planctomycetota bacterium]